MALAPKGLPPRLSGAGKQYSCPLQSCGEAGERSETEEDCCLIIRKKLFNKDNINYKNFNPLSSLGCCLVPTPLSRGGNPFGSASHFPYQGNLPRLLGKARPYYLIVPLLNQRFREMKGQAQHDRKKE